MELAGRWPFLSFLKWWHGSRRRNDEPGWWKCHLAGLLSTYPARGLCWVPRCFPGAPPGFQGAWVRGHTVRGALDRILWKISLLKEWSGIGTGCPGNGGVIVPGGVQKDCRCGTLGHGLAGMVVLGWWLDLMISEVFSNLWFYDSLRDQGCGALKGCRTSRWT